MDFLLVAISITSAGLIFGTTGPFGEGEGYNFERPWAWPAIGVRLVLILAMFASGSQVLHLFGDEDSTWTMWRMAAALWLPPFLVAGLAPLIPGRSSSSEPEGE